MNNLGGFDEEIRDEEVTEKKVVDLTEERKKRKPFHYWTVGGREYRLKLKASTIGKLENKYQKNILNMIDDMPTLSVMLTIIQAAMEPWEHGIDYVDVQKLYDKWTEEDGNQTDLFSKVIIPIMAVSGFFPEKQAVAILEGMGNE